MCSPPASRCGASPCGRCLEVERGEVGGAEHDRSRRVARRRGLDGLAGLLQGGAVVEIFPDDLLGQGVELRVCRFGFPRVENGNLDLRVDGEAGPLKDHFSALVGTGGRRAFHDAATVHDHSQFVGNDGVGQTLLHGALVGSVRERERLGVLGGLERDATGIDERAEQRDNRQARRRDGRCGCRWSVGGLRAAGVLVGRRGEVEGEMAVTGETKDTIDIATLLSSWCVLGAGLAVLPVEARSRRRKEDKLGFIRSQAQKRIILPNSGMGGAPKR